MADAGNFAVLNETRLLANADQRSNIVEQIDKQEGEENFQKAKAQRCTKIKLKKRGTGMRKGKNPRGPVADAAGDSYSSCGKDPKKNGCVDLAGHQNDSHSQTEAGDLHSRIVETA